MKINVENLSPEELELFNKEINNFRNNSELFNFLYEELDYFDKILTIKLSDKISFDVIAKGGAFIIDKNGNYNIEFQVIVDSEQDKQITNFTSAEEFFHAYRNVNISEYGSQDANLEYEAKLFSTLSVDQGTEIDGLSQTFTIANNEDTIKLLISYINDNQNTTFPRQYYNQLPEFINYYKTFDPGPEYLKSCQVPQYSIIKLMKQFLKK
ncbi:MAG: hypothetical protein NC338_04365 [Firmicutes bacterium]|nr:hypothetical protein [Bacillota bacterium]MCM1401469.1 hypothetical protein [Bacteroides sp.]MCM1477404.1 hypothetical protein [Bacteroides sp.]